MRRRSAFVLVVVIVVGSVAATGILQRRANDDSGHPSANAPGAGRPAIQTGTAVILDPSPVPSQSYTVAPAKPYSGRVLLKANPPETNTGAATFRLAATMTLDVKTLVPLDRKNRIEVDMPSDVQTNAEARFELPPLAPGRHCLVVTLSEESEVGAAVSMATLVHVDAGPGEDHCLASRSSVAAASVGEVARAVGCFYPLLGTSPTEGARTGRPRSGQALWLHVPICPGARAVSYLFFRDGLPVLDDDIGATAPGSVPLSGTHSVSIGGLRRGFWRALVVSPGSSEADSNAVLSNAVAVK